MLYGCLLGFVGDWCLPCNTSCQRWLTAKRLCQRWWSKPRLTLSHPLCHWAVYIYIYICMYNILPGSGSGFQCEWMSSHILFSFGRPHCIIQESNVCVFQLSYSAVASKLINGHWENVSTLLGACFCQRAEITCQLWWSKFRFKSFASIVTSFSTSACVRVCTCVCVFSCVCARVWVAFAQVCWFVFCP